MWLEKELATRREIPEIRTFDRHIIHPAERKELKSNFPLLKEKPWVITTGQL